MKKTNLGLTLGLFAIVGPVSVYGASVGSGQADSFSVTSIDQPALYGTWSGDFHPKHADVAPFTVTIAIKPETNRSMAGKAIINSGCLQGTDVDLQVTVEGQAVSLVGSDEDGNSLSIQGTIDKTRAIITSDYIINGSATGRCEVDGGMATLIKQ